MSCEKRRRVQTEDARTHTLLLLAFVRVGNVDAPVQKHKTCTHPNRGAVRSAPKVTSGPWLTSSVDHGFSAFLGMVLQKIYQSENRGHLFPFLSEAYIWQMLANTPGLISVQQSRSGVRSHRHVECSNRESTCSAAAVEVFFFSFSKSEKGHQYAQKIGEEEGERGVRESHEVLQSYSSPTPALTRLQPLSDSQPVRPSYPYFRISVSCIAAGSGTKSEPGSIL